MTLETCDWLVCRALLHVVNTVHMVLIWATLFFPPELECRHRHSATHMQMHTDKHGDKYTQYIRTHTRTLTYAEMQKHTLEPSEQHVFFSLRSLYSLIPALWLSDPTMAYSGWLLLQLIASHGQCALIELP